LVAFEGVRGNGDVSFRSDTPESASGFREAACQTVGQEGLWIMSNGTVSGDFVAFIPYAIEPDWDDVYAPRLAGFPVNLCYAEFIQGSGMACATYVFDPTTFVADVQSRQMRYRPKVDSDFSVLIKLHRDGGIHTFKYRGSEIIREASGSDFRSAMIHTTACGLALDEPIDHQDSARQPCD
jgi:hypothetical protein